jgi:hypothetical protein
MGRTKLKPILEEPLVFFFEKIKLGLEVLLKMKNHTTLVCT